jgi:REP element-mobilizing transposase RayT
MARKPRIEYPGVFYHVITRVNKREDIFLDDAGRRRFLDKLAEYRKRYDFVVYAYALFWKRGGG